MLIKLFQPPTKNWLLIAEQLNDPPTWDRFVPCHTTESERWQFDSAVKVEAAATGVKLKPCKEAMSRGVSVFEYDWNTPDDDILHHAMQVAELLQLGLKLEEPATQSRSSYTAA